MRGYVLIALVCAVRFAPSPAAAQTSSGAQELYHAHFVKAAPGKLPDLIAGVRGGARPGRRAEARNPAASRGGRLGSACSDAIR